MTPAWQVHVSDGTTLYFVTQAEANLYAKDTEEAGFRVLVSPFKPSREPPRPPNTCKATKGSRT